MAKVFDRSSTAAITPGSSRPRIGANVWFYDSQATSDVDLYGFENKDISHVTFCWNYADGGREDLPPPEWTKTIGWGIVMEYDGSYSGTASTTASRMATKSRLTRQRPRPHGRGGPSPSTTRRR